MAGKEENLSVEESNALREKLGLKPLHASDGSINRMETTYEDADPRAKKAATKQELQSEKDRAKHDSTRAKLVKGKGVVDGVDEDAGDWVAKMRSGGGAKPAAPKQDKAAKAGRAGGDLKKL